MQSSEASSVKKSWFLVYTLFRTSWYKRYDWGKKDFQHLICRTAVHSQCFNCRNLILGLCLVQLISHYQKLLELDGAFLSLWKTFKYSFMKQVIFLEAQEAFNLKPPKSLKGMYGNMAHIRWIIHKNHLKVRAIYWYVRCDFLWKRTQWGKRS